MPEPLSKFLEKLKELLMSDKVRPFVWLYYIPLWFWGIYGVFFSAPFTFVKPVMGHGFYLLWEWMHLVGTTVVMLGLRFEDVSKNGKLGWIGIGFQTGGHGCMFFVLLSFEFASYATALKTPLLMYTCFVISPYVIGCLLLTIQSLVKSFNVEFVNRNMPYYKAINELK